LDTLHKSGASSSGLPPTRRNIESETAAAFSALVALLPNGLLLTSSATPNSSQTPTHPLLGKSLEFQASLVADIVHARNFTENEVWNRCVGVYISPWLGGENSLKFAETVRSHFQGVDQVFCSHLLIHLDNALNAHYLGQAHCNRPKPGRRRRAALRHLILASLWCTSPSFSYETPTLSWTPLRYPRNEWLWQVHLDALIA
jgi:hypothetical protein